MQQSTVENRPAWDKLMETLITYGVPDARERFEQDGGDIGAFVDHWSAPPEGLKAVSRALTDAFAESEAIQRNLQH